MEHPDCDGRPAGLASRRALNTVPMPDLPSGTVTFLFTDIEGSTRLWEAHPDAMRVALRSHDDLLRACIESHGGHVFKTVGDAFCAAFANPREGLDAALACQQGLPALGVATADGALPLKVRIALHTGVVEERDGDYFGPSLNRVARVLATGHGCQVLLSLATAELVRDNLPTGAALRSLGEHRLKDLGRPESLFQLLHPELPDDFPPLRSLDNPELRHNLPQQVTSFVGREAQIAEVKRLLEKTRLLTLTGSGGSGKTRLALQVAADLLDGLRDGVWVVEFAPLTDPNLVASTAASVLELREEAEKPMQQTLTEHLRSKHLLLILDNCEHLLTACAQLADALLRHCPRVLILATSREGLGIAGETTYRVPSLTLPDAKQPRTPESLSHYEAVRLFIDRATQVQTTFAVTNRNAPALASICHRLDGIPLAIELAAARAHSLTVEDINARLDQRFRLLTRGSRTALPRQQTLRSLIDWSYDLLNAAEKALLCRLSVFLGGWTLEAAEAVCSGEPVPPGGEAWETLDLLTSLCDKSLVVSETAGQSVRYRLLETVRQYARDRLLEGGEWEKWRDAHLAYFLALGVEAGPHLSGPDQQTWLERWETEHDNLRVALEWAAEQSNWEAGLCLAGAVWRFWYVRGHFAEGRRRLSRLLAAVTPDRQTSARAGALTGAGVLAYCQGEYEAARALFHEALTIRRALEDQPGVAGLLNNLGNVAYDQADYGTARAFFEESLLLRRALGDRRGLSATLNNLGNVFNEQGDYPTARRLFEESLALKQELGDRWGMAHCLSNLGLVACHQDDLPGARAFFDEGLAIRRDIGDRAGIALSLNNLGHVAIERGDGAAARAHFVESLTIERELGDRWGMAFSLEGLAGAGAAAGDAIAAARLWGAAERLRADIGAPLPPTQRRSYERWVSAARAAQGDEAAFDAAWAEGRALTLEPALDLALEAPDA